MTWMIIRLILSLAFVGVVLWFAARLAKKRGLGQGNGVIEITARVFQFVFGQLALGDIAFLVFIAAVVILFRPTTDKRESTALALFLTVPFMLACVASMVGLYPYGGTRHSAFLALFVIAGVSVSLSRVRWRSITGRTLALTTVLLSTAFGSQHRPYMRREDQSRVHMDAAINALHQQAPANAVLFVDPQTSLQFGHYLCEQKLTPRDTSTPVFESYYCGGFHVITPATNDMIFNVQRFFMEWDRMVHAFSLQEGETIYVIQAGWDTHLAQDLQGSGGFQALKPQFFGRNISFFNMAVGRSPAK